MSYRLDVVDRTGRWIVAGAAVWILVAALGSGPSPDRTTWLGTASLDTVAQLAPLMLALLGLGALLAMGRIRRGDWQTPTDTRLGRSLVLFVAFTGLLIIGSRSELIERLIDRLRNQPDTSPSGVASVAVADSEVPTEPAPETVAEVRDLLLLSLLIALAGVTVWWLRRRVVVVDEPCAGESSDGAAVDLQTATDLATERLLSDVGDPRTRVQLAYRELEEALGGLGLGRDASETSAEHMQRSIDGLGVDATAFVALGALYERARFSHSAIAEADVERAAAQLDTAIHSISEPA